MHRYGIYQATQASCILYKEDKDGKQSTFTVLNKKKDTDRERDLLLFIDNEMAEKENIFHEGISSTMDLLQAFNDWAQDAPVVFEMEAQTCLSRCLQQKNEND